MKKLDKHVDEIKSLFKIKKTKKIEIGINAYTWANEQKNPLYALCDIVDKHFIIKVETNPNRYVFKRRSEKEVTEWEKFKKWADKEHKKIMKEMDEENEQKK